MAKLATKPQPKGKGKESVRILISRTKLQRRITEMAREIRKDFPDEPLHLVGVLKGAVFFLTDLGKQIPGDVSFDFIAVSSYGIGTHSSGQVRLTRDLDSSIEGKTVIVGGYSGHGNDPAVFTAGIRTAPAQADPRRRAAGQTRTPRRGGARRLCGLHDSQRVCGGLRPGLR